MEDRPGDGDAASVAYEIRKRTRLRTMRRIATGLLVLMAGLFLVAQAHLGSHPAWGYVAAFAEAAMVGAIADWFAVVALFRHPLGIPIWHTAIIPERKGEIARTLGAFVESHFVTVDALVARIRAFDPASRLSSWLMQSHNADRVGAGVAAAARQILATVDDGRIRDRLRQSLTQRLAARDLATPLADLGFDLVARDRHHELFDWALRRLQDWLDTEGAEDTIDVALDAVLNNKVLAIFKDTVAIRLRAGLKDLAEAAEQEPDHPLRLRYDAFVAEWLVRLRTDPDVARRLGEWQSATLTHPRLQAVFDGLWAELRRWLEEDLARDEPALARQTARIATEWSRRLADDGATRGWINESLVAVVTPLINDNRGKVAAFIQAQIDTWSKEEMTARMELAVGRDLQFIRINGTLVGGLVGLVLHGAIGLLHGA